MKGGQRLSLLNDETIFFGSDHIFVISKQWHCGGRNHAKQFQVQSRAKEGMNKVEITSMRENAFLVKSYLKLGLECCPSRTWWSPRNGAEGIFWTQL